MKSEGFPTLLPVFPGKELASPPCALCWVLQKRDSEIDVCLQEVYWGSVLGSHSGKGRKESWTGKNFSRWGDQTYHKLQRLQSISWQVLELGWFLKDVPPWGKGALYWPLINKPANAGCLCSGKWRWVRGSLLLRPITGEEFRVKLWAGNSPSSGEQVPPAWKGRGADLHVNNRAYYNLSHKVVCTFLHFTGREDVNIKSGVTMDYTFHYHDGVNARPQWVEKRGDEEGKEFKFYYIVKRRKAVCDTEGRRDVEIFFLRNSSDFSISTEWEKN